MTLTTTCVGSINSNITSYGQMMSSGQQDMPSMGVKITSPSDDQKVAIGDNTDFKVTGSSTDTNKTDCKVSVILNNVKPYQEAIPTGPGGNEDYSTWSFVLNPSYNGTIKEGTNKVTSKLSCPNPNENSSALATHYSVFFAGADSSISSNSTATTATSVSTSQQEEQQEPSSSIATLARPLQDNKTIIQLSDSTPSDDNADDRVSNTKKEATTAAATSISESSSTATPTTMIFTIYQEGKLESSSTSKQEKTTTQSVATTSSTSSPSPRAPLPSYVSTCDQNLPISSFSAIGDDGDDAIPQNAFDNNLDTRWSHDSTGSWIILDLGTVKDICSVDIAWYRGDERSYGFVISLSEDGNNFKDLFKGTSRGDTLSPERYKITDSASTVAGAEAAPMAVSARYVKITINGNNDTDTEENQWGAITEVDINGRQSDEVNSNTITQSQSLSASTPSLATESGETIIMQISGSYEQNSRDNGPIPPRIDPSRLEGTITVIDSTTNKKILEYDLAPINIAFTQLFKKITVKAGIDDPIKTGNVTSTMKFSSPIDVQKGGFYATNLTATDTVRTGSTGGNMLLAKISGGQTFLTRGNIMGNITIQSP